MTNPSLVIESENKTNPPMLIIDKEGTIGNLLASKLKNESLIVFLTGNEEFLEEESEQEVIKIPFRKKIPEIPENHYSHIFLIDDKGILRESINIFLNKTKRDNSKLVFVTTIFDVKKEVLNQILKSESDSKIVVCGDVFSKKNAINDQSEVNQFIEIARKYGKLDIPGDGTDLLYPVEEEKVAKGILEATFGTYKNKKEFLLFPKTGITYLSFSRMLQKNNPWLKIDFIKKKKSPKIIFSIFNQAHNLINDKFFLEDVKSLILEDKAPASRKKKKRKQTSFLKTLGKRSTMLYICFFIILLLIMPIISTFFLAYAGTFFLQNAKKNLVSANLEKTAKNAKASGAFFNLALHSSKALEYEFLVVGARDYATSIVDKINTGKNISQASIGLLEGVSAFIKVANGQEEKPEEEFYKGLSSVKHSLAVLQHEKNKETLSIGDNTEIDQVLNFTSSIINLLPSLVGLDEKKTYLVLFQNNMELRPGGGFIGSYGKISVDKGRFSELEIHDVYDADGQLKAHIEPPFYLRKYLGVSHLFFRDSNFDPDFRDVASMSAMMFSLATGERINGVIGVNLNVVKNILDSVGEIDVIDYDEKVNSENLFYVTESHVEKGFFPGSTQKKDFLKALYSSLLNRLSKDKEISYLGLIDSAIKSVNEKHLLFVLDTPNVQSIFTANGWSSTLWDKREVKEGVINDFLGISESNLGANKVNYFISRSIAQEVSVSNGLAKDNLTLTYKNDSDGQWPGGDYKNYLRIILPSEAEVSEIFINDKKQKIVSSVTDPNIYEKEGYEQEGLELRKDIVRGKAIFGFMVTIPKKELVEIKVSYNFPVSIKTESSSWTYDLKVFKQPGIDSMPYSLGISAPEGFNIVKSTENVIAKKEGGTYISKIVKDENVSIEFSKKD